MSIADAFFLAQNISPDHHLKTAIVEREEYRNSADFQNLVFRNSGHSNLHLFYDYDEALNWPREQQ